MQPNLIIMTGSWSIDIFSCSNYWHRKQEKPCTLSPLSLSKWICPWPSILPHFVRLQLTLYHRESVFHNSTTKHVTPSINIYTNTHSSRRNTRLQKRMQENGQRMLHVYANKFHPSTDGLWSLSSSGLTSLMIICWTS